jgi:hypothetical protein
MARFQTKIARKPEWDGSFEEDVGPAEAAMGGWKGSGADRGAELRAGCSVSRRLSIRNPVVCPRVRGEHPARADFGSGPSVHVETVSLDNE